jgi:hypothetical protein
MLAPEPSGSQSAREERGEVRVYDRDGFEDFAPANPVLFTYPADLYSLEETLRRAQPIEQVVA